MEISLDEPLNTDWDGNELLLSEVLGTDEDIVMRPMEEETDKMLLREALATLEERERDIIVKRYGLDGGRPLTQREVAKKLDISRSYVSRIEKKALEKLYDKYEGK